MNSCAVAVRHAGKDNLHASVANRPVKSVGDNVTHSYKQKMRHLIDRQDAYMLEAARVTARPQPLA